MIGMFIAHLSAALSNFKAVGYEKLNLMENRIINIKA